MDDACLSVWVDRIIAQGRKPLLILDPKLDATAVVTHYKGKVKAYEIGNECSDSWDAKLYAIRLSAAYKAIKAVDPTATVITCGNQGHQNGGIASRWLHRVLDVTHDFDAVGVHLYPSSMADIDRIPEMLANLKAVIWAHLGKLVPIWNTEFGVLSPRFRSETRASQKETIRRMMRHASECAVSIWYAFDHDSMGLGADPNELAGSITAWNEAIAA